MPVARLAAIGLAAGLLGALLGVGGGIVIVPLLVYLLGYDQRRAAATSIAAIGMMAAVASASYAALGHVHGPEAALLGVPAALGALGGTALQQRVPLRGLQFLFALLLLVVGLRLLAPGWFAFHEVGPRADWVYGAAIAVGAVAGVLAGLFGVGGGTLFVPALVLLLGLSQIDADATSLLAMLPASWLSAWRQTRYGNVVWSSSIAIGVASIVGVEGGIAIAERLPEATLRRLFGVLLVLTAARVALRAARKRS